MGEKAILEGTEVVIVDDFEEWINWFGAKNRHVGGDMVGDIFISTVFLGINHQPAPYSKPQWFETMIFGGEHDGYQERYETWAQAELGHALALALVCGQQRH